MKTAYVTLAVDVPDDVKSPRKWAREQLEEWLDLMSKHGLVANFSSIREYKTKETLK